MLPIKAGVLSALPMINPMAENLNKIQPTNSNFFLDIDLAYNFWNKIFKVKKTFVTIFICHLI